MSCTTSHTTCTTTTRCGDYSCSNCYPSDCNNSNPCYDNCGCLNPTTFDCVTNPSANYSNIPLLAGKTGADLLIALDAAILALKTEQYKVKINSTDLCPATLLSKVIAGPNITIDTSGTGCDIKLRITGGVDIGPAPTDSKVRASGVDTTSGYLDQKIISGTYTIAQPIGSGNQQFKIDVVPATLISTDTGNCLTLGLDGGIKTTFTDPDGSETKLVAGPGVNISGAGTLANPYLIYTNGTLVPARSGFNGTWVPLTLTNGGNTNVTVSSNSVKYRIRWDGTIEFKGNVTYTTLFSVITTNKITLTNVAAITLGSNTTTLSAAEIDRDVDLKNVLNFDAPTTLDISPTMTYYTIRMMKTTGRLNIDLATTESADKVIVLSFDGCQYHPNI